MNQKLFVVKWLGFAVLCLGIVCLLVLPDKRTGTARISMLNIGQGDSFLIQAKNGKQLLIDGGRDATVLAELSKVIPKGDRSIDVVIATHPDADHIGGLSGVLKRYRVGLFLTSQVGTDTDVFKQLNTVVLQKHIPAYYVRRGMHVVLDRNNSATFTVLFPDRNTSGWETNTASVVGRLQIGQTSALFTGDSPISIEHFLSITDPKNIDVDILKLGHHGSKTSSSEEFLRTASPILALISAGVNNRYGHPHKEVIDRLNTLHISWISTQDTGTVTLTTDGTGWKYK